MSDLTLVAEISLAEIVEGSSLVSALTVDIYTEVQVLWVGASSVHD